MPGATRKVLDLVYTSGIDKPQDFYNLCHEMYEEKTRKRIAKFLQMHPEINFIRSVNGIPVKPIELYLDTIPWDYINQTSVASEKFHGDVQPENIIVKPDGSVAFIDWRDGFAGNLEVGDMYYDLGKLWHDLIVSNQKILEKRFTVNTKDDLAQISLDLKPNLIEAMATMKSYCIEKNLDWQKIEILGALQYLTIACLYNDPKFSTFLFLLGKLCLELLEHGTGKVLETIKYENIN